MFVPLSDEVDQLAEDIVDAIGDVRAELGRGLLERGYAGALEAELVDRGHLVEREVLMPLTYKRRQVSAGFLVNFNAVPLRSGIKRIIR